MSEFRGKNRISGTPIWLFKLPLVAKVLYFWLSTLKSNSLVVVFPLVPVIPITGSREMFPVELRQRL